MKKYSAVVAMYVLIVVAGACAVPTSQNAGSHPPLPDGPPSPAVLHPAAGGQLQPAADAAAPETLNSAAPWPDRGQAARPAAAATAPFEPAVLQPNGATFEPASSAAGTALGAPLAGVQDAVQALLSAPPFTGTLLIADAGNNRLLALTPDKQVVWRFPAVGSLAAGQTFYYPDDAFFSADGRSIAVNAEYSHVIAVISYPEGKLVWQFGQPGVPGRDLHHLNRPDDAHLLPDGQVAVADIRNCRILLIPWDQGQPRALGSSSDCSGRPGTFARPNGVMPLPNGDLLVTEIYSRHISEIDRQGRVVRMVTLPLYYPSDAILTPRDTMIVSDYHSPGRVVEADWTGRILWSFPPPGSREQLDRPSIAFELPDPPGAPGSRNVLIVDDHRHRVLIVNRAGLVLWQYGVTDAPGSGPGRLNTPDGVDLLPPGS